LVDVCPDVVAAINAGDITCTICLTSRIAGESNPDMFTRCTTTFDSVTAANCRFAFGGAADHVIITSRPVLESNYFEFPADINYISNHGLQYAKITGAYGAPINLYCTHLVVELAGMPVNYMEQVNYDQSLASLAIIQQTSKPDEVSVLMGDTNSGGSFGNIVENWGDNFAVFPEAGFVDALPTRWTDKVNGTCTWGCNYLSEDQGVPVPFLPRWIDHVLSTGHNTFKFHGFPIKSVPVCQRRGRVVLDEPVVDTPAGMVTLSDHAGVVSHICNNWQHHPSSGQALAIEHEFLSE